MRKLDICPSDHLNRFDDPVGIVLEPLLQLGAYRKHRRGTERISGVHAHGVDVLDEAYGNHLVLGVPDDLQLELFPAEHGLLN